VSQPVELDHEGADLLLVVLLEIARLPSRSRCRAPTASRRVIAVLVDHGPQHVGGLSLETVAAQATAAQGISSHQEPQLVARLQHTRDCWLVPEADEVGAILLDERHLLADDVLGDGGPTPAWSSWRWVPRNKRRLPLSLNGPCLTNS